MIDDDDLLILSKQHVANLLVGKEASVLDAVYKAYGLHGRGESSLPHSTFLRFPGNQLDRIIALPAWLGGEFFVAGMKWIASFPNNVDKGLERASAIIVMNCPNTGRPRALMEGSLISAHRTAASAAMAAQHLVRQQPSTVGIVGCGRISAEIVRYIRYLMPSVKEFAIYDVDRERAEHFARNIGERYPNLSISLQSELEAVLSKSTLVSLATTATNPFIGVSARFLPGTTVLHVSLRDLTPDLILSCDNVVDDVEHVLREGTSLHLAAKRTAGTGFIRCTLPDILTGACCGHDDKKQLTVFSPFGLGVLDLAVASVVMQTAAEVECGSTVKSFHSAV